MAKPNETVVEANGQRHTSFFGFFAESVREMRRVRWPKRREVAMYTFAALIVCAILGLFIWGFDIGVSRLMSLIGVD
jgi:preprotein translocase subunit SecE